MILNYFFLLKTTRLFTDKFENIVIGRTTTRRESSEIFEMFAIITAIASSPLCQRRWPAPIEFVAAVDCVGHWWYWDETRLWIVGWFDSIGNDYHFFKKFVLIVHVYDDEIIIERISFMVVWIRCWCLYWRMFIKIDKFKCFRF